MARLMLLGLVTSIGLAVMIWGRGPGHLEDLTAALAAGRLNQVTVVGNGLPPGATGCASQHVVWREHLLRRQAAIALQAGDESGCTAVSGTLVPGIRDAAAYVQQLDPDVGVRRVPERTSSFFIGSWHVPGLVALLALLAALVQLALIISGPQPWRATRWAWFWLSGSLVGALAFITLSGPFPRVAAPPRPERRLTGGWAFLLSIVLSSIGPAWVLGWPHA